MQGRPKGSKNKATLLREQLVRDILAEKLRRDDDVDPEGTQGGFLGSLDKKAFVDVLKQIIPKNIDVGGEGFGSVLAALQAKVSGE